MTGRTKTSPVKPEPWWAKFVLALIKLVLAFALAVLTLILTNPARYDPDPVESGAKRPVPPPEPAAPAASTDARESAP